MTHDELWRHWKPDYEHVKCDNCGGHIGCFNRIDYECNVCGKIFSIYRLKYDRLEVNDKTGWVFPVLRIKRDVQD